MKLIKKPAYLCQERGYKSSNKNPRSKHYLQKYYLKWYSETKHDKKDPVNGVV